MRLFVAVYPPPAAMADLARAVDQLRLSRWARSGSNMGLTARPRWHVTLVFLGELAGRHVPAAIEAVQAGVDRWRSGSSAPPRLRLAGGGRFGRQRFTVVWAGLAGDVEGLSALVGQVRQALRREALPYDDHKAFLPHLTFARPGDRLPPSDLAADLAALADYRGPWWQVEEVRLVRSRLGPNPDHQPLVEVPLQTT